LGVLCSCPRVGYLAGEGESRAESRRLGLLRIREDARGPLDDVWAAAIRLGRDRFNQLIVSVGGRSTAMGV
jgi:hypothetical protein